MKVCGVVLSGGESKRFDGDKAFAVVDGEPMVRLVARSLFESVGYVWLSVKDERQGEKLMEACTPYVTGYLVDEFSAGPLSGLLTAADKIEADVFLSCPNDVPRIRSATLKKMLEFLTKETSSAVSIFWADGSVETLIQAVRKDSIIKYRKIFLDGRKNLVRASDLLRGCERALLVYGGNLTDDPFEFSNINTVDDITHPKPKALTKGAVRENIMLSTVRNFSKAVEEYLNGNLFEAGLAYFSESIDFVVRTILHLGLHAASDASKMFELAGALEARRLSDNLKEQLKGCTQMR